MNPPVFKCKSLSAALDYMAWSQPFVIQFSNQLALVQPLPLIICLLAALSCLTGMLITWTPLISYFSAVTGKNKFKWWIVLCLCRFGPMCVAVGTNPLPFPVFPSVAHLCVIALIIVLVIIILWRAVACWVRTEVLMDWEKSEGWNKRIQ